MHIKARPCSLIAQMTLGAVAVLGAVTLGGSEPKAQELEWARSAGGIGSDGGRSIATDRRGNSYVTGQFSGTATFGAGEPNETELTGNVDLFVAKYDPDGTLLWAKSAGGPSVEDGIGIATDPIGNSYVTGQFFGAATFGAGEANETVLSPVGSQDMFLAKYAPDGTLLWAKSAGGTGQDHGSSIATDPRGNTYVTGPFEGTATFGAGEDNETELSSAGDFDIFVAKYAPDGTLLWAKSAGSSQNGGEFGDGIATDHVGNSYVTGQFLGTATFGAGEDNETELTAGDVDIFVAKYAQDGTLAWAKSAGGVSIDHGAGIAAVPRGNSYVTGRFSGIATFGAGEDNEVKLEAQGQTDVFVAKYAPDGTLLWAKSVGGPSVEIGLGIATDLRGNSHVIGQFSGTATFGEGEDNETTLTAAGNVDLFVAKYHPNGAFLWATSAGGAGFDQGIGIATDALGNSYVTGVFFAMATFGAGEPNETDLEPVGSSDVFVAKYRR